MKSAPPPSVISQTLWLIAKVDHDELASNYREAWFLTLDSLKGQGFERSARDADKTPYPDPAGDQVADQEARRKSLLRASDKLDRALALLREAKGLVDYAGGLEARIQVKGAPSQAWSKKEMDSVNGAKPSRGTIRTG